MKIDAYLGREIYQVKKKDNTWESRITDKKFFINFAKFAHIGFFAKSGTGKSYAVGVMIEEAILAENNPFATIIIDPLGTFSTMRSSNRTGEIENWNTKVNKLDMVPKGMDPKKLIMMIPAESVSKTDKLMYDCVFSISAKNFSEDLFAYAFGFKILDPQVSLYRKVRHQLLKRKESEKKELTFSLQDIIAEIRTVDYHSETKDALIHRLEDLECLEIITESAPQIYDIIKPNKAIIFNLSSCSIFTKRLIVNFFAKQILECRNLISSKINLAKIKFDLEEENWKQYNDWYLPPTRLIIDEAHEFIPKNTTLKTYIKEGRNHGCVIGFISQSADLDDRVLANMSHLFIGPMRQDKDINILRTLTATEKTPAEFKTQIKSQKNGCFSYYNLDEVGSEKIIQFRPRYSYHPAGNEVENEKEWIQTPDDDEEIDSEVLSEEEEIREDVESEENEIIDSEDVLVDEDVSDGEENSLKCDFLVLLKNGEYCCDQDYSQKMDTDPRVVCASCANNHKEGRNNFD